LFTQGAESDASEIVAVNAHGASSGGVETRQEIDKGGLSGAAGADERDDGAGWNFE
jgi:hypothetical protein